MYMLFIRLVCYLIPMDFDMICSNVCLFIIVAFHLNIIDYDMEYKATSQSIEGNFINYMLSLLIKASALRFIQSFRKLCWTLENSFAFLFMFSYSHYLKENVKRIDKYINVNE